MSKILLFNFLFSFCLLSQNIDAEGQSYSLRLFDEESRHSKDELQGSSLEEAEKKFEIVDSVNINGKEIDVFKQCEHLVDKKFFRKQRKALRLSESAAAKRSDAQSSSDIEIKNEYLTSANKKEEKSVSINTKIAQDIESCNSRARGLSGVLGSDFNFKVDMAALIEEVKLKVGVHAAILKTPENTSKIVTTCKERAATILDKNIESNLSSALEKIELKITELSTPPLEETEDVITPLSEERTKQITELKASAEKIKEQIIAQKAKSNDLRGSQGNKVLDIPLYKNLKRIVKSSEYVSHNTEDKGAYKSYVVPNDKYFNRICEMLISATCSGSSEVSCIKNLMFEAKLAEELSKQGNLKLSDKYDAFVNSIAFESYKMIGHSQALKELEIYLVDEKNFEVFEGAEQYMTPTGSKCQRPSAYTVDFKACQSIAGAHNIHSITNLSKDIFGGAADQINQSVVQRDMERDIASGANNQDAAFNAQKKILKGQRDIASTAGATYLASSGVVGVMLSSYPTAKEYAKRCNRGESLEVGKPPFCYLIQNTNLRTMFPNSQVKAEGYGLLGSLIGETIKYGVEAYTLNDLAKQTQGMQNDLNSALEEVATVGFDSCLNNPTLCNNQAGEAQTTTLGMGDFSIGSNGYDSQAFVQPGAESTGDIDTSTGISKTEAQQLGDSLRDGGNSLSESFNKISAGDLGGRSGGSGGSSGGGGAPGGGGGSSGGGAAPQAAGTSGASGVPKISTSFTKGRNIAFKKGKSAKKKSSSPYSNLFNKSKTNRNIASEINDIADKESGLFKKISKRYETLKSKNRLK